MNSDAPAHGTILVVDDHEVLSRVPVMFLKHVGFAVLEATSGEQALRMVQDRQPPIDLMLIDVEMPGMNGRELSAWVLTVCPTPRMILMGGREGDPATPTSAYHCTVLPKPLDLDGLLDLLRVILPPLPPVEDGEPEAALPRVAGSPV